MVIEHVEAEVVREIFRRQHQSPRCAAQDVVAPFGFHLAPACLFGAKIKVEPEEHEEDEQRVFLGDAIVGDGIDAESPERGGQESCPAVEESCREEKERNCCERAKEDRKSTRLN